MKKRDFHLTYLQEGGELTSHPDRYCPDCLHRWNGHREHGCMVGSCACPRVDRWNSYDAGSDQIVPTREVEQ